MAEYRINGKLYVGGLNDSVKLAKGLSLIDNWAELLITTTNGAIRQEYAKGIRISTEFIR